MVSVVIPMYGRATYIEDCIKSILNQTYMDLEIICVLDGSSNEIRSVLSNFEEDKRLKIHEVSHGGVAKARNYGLKQVNGDYIMFVDADDIIPSNAIELLTNAIIEKQADVVLGDYIEIYDSGEKVYFETPSDEEDDFNSYLESVTLWNRIFKASFIRSNNLAFNENIIAGDDRIFCADSFLKKPIIFVIHEDVYHWLRHENDLINSMTHSRKASQFENDLMMWNLFMDKMKDCWEDRMNEHMRYSCDYILKRFSDVENNEKKQAVFIKLKELVSRIEWTGYNKLFEDIFKISKSSFDRIIDYRQFNNE